MKGTTKFAWATAGALAFALLMAATIGGSAAARPTIATANATTYQDSTGENPAAPDIGTVVVSNDDAGLVSFAIQFTNRGVRGSTDYTWVNLDTDVNATTGEPPVGFDYAVQVGPGHSEVFRWDVGQQDWVLAPMSTLRTDWANSTLTVHVNTSDLGGASTFAFGVDAATDYSNGDTYDWAPDHLPLWMYDVKLAPVLTIAALDVTAQPAMAGKAMVANAMVTVTRGGKAEALASTASVEWSAKVGDLALNASGTTVGAKGALGAAWAIPPTTTEKTVQLTLTVTQEGVTATKALTVPLAHPAPVLRMTALDCTPEPAVPGKALVGKANIVVTRAGTPVALPATAKVRWTAVVGTLRLTQVSSKVAPKGVLHSTWQLPETVKAKTVAVTVTVTLEKVTVTKSHQHRIK